MQNTDASRWIKLGLAALLLNLLLISPNHPQAVTWQALSMLAIELPLILLLLVVLPADRLIGRCTRTALVVAIMATFVLKGADFLMRVAFERNFNLITDWDIVAAGWTTLAAAIGYPITFAALLAVVATLALIGWLVWRSLSLWLLVTPSPIVKMGAYAAILVLGPLAVADYGHLTNHWQLENKLPIDTFAARNAARYVTDTFDTVRAQQEFRRIAATQSIDNGPGTLAKLKGHNVLILFVESYGRASLENPIYADTQLTTLQSAQTSLGNKGLAMRSGWLDAPTIGGQSWLSHSTLATGLWISNQGRYQAMLANPRHTLFHDAESAGFTTVAMMPALRMAWPDGDYFGFDRVYQAGDLGYQGEPFNWVLVPDQFVLMALDQLELNQADNDLFVQAALSSSHAPFTPVPDLLDWETLGDGRVFNDKARSGDTPEVVWSDTNRVREQYRLAVNYSLRTVFEYVERHATRPDLVIVLGDHEPAPFIGGQPGTEVPMHIIGSPELIEQIDSWGWATGLVPAPELAVWTMADWREKFVNAYSIATKPHSRPNSDAIDVGDGRH